MNNNDLHKIDTLKDEEIIKIMQDDYNLDEEMLEQFKAYASNFLYKSDLEHFEESYQGEYASDENFTRELLESSGIIPDDLPIYIHIDWEATAKDIMMDYFEVDGYYFRSI